ncbi:hypothetical protein [Streptomyces sp. NPDC058268]|uniref:hypothetical protein n=1 Tax=Streptomyces sp. NPDC058268 TaxID=3346413 RepID=UPI0036E1E605
MHEGIAQPGDVLYDTKTLTHALGGPRTKATAGLVLGRVAVSYGLVRNRPGHADDPPAPFLAAQAMTWEISPAARTLATLAAEEFEVMDRLTLDPVR